MRIIEIITMLTMPRENALAAFANVYKLLRKYQSRQDYLKLHSREHVLNFSTTSSERIMSAFQRLIREQYHGQQNRDERKNEEGRTDHRPEHNEQRNQQGREKHRVRNLDRNYRPSYPDYVFKDVLVNYVSSFFFLDEPSLEEFLYVILRDRRRAQFESLLDVPDSLRLSHFVEVAVHGECRPDEHVFLGLFRVFSVAFVSQGECEYSFSGY